ncbi:phage tail assembly protein [Dethiosulfatarculus sandiegensis]|uniref:Phage tail assembly protein n=1 Tax=Dethiosulfatarculus sandiegensis TaxID=1429043 RepID=A0A0D2JFD8_9BACT|nr:phage tail assembly protein [Dethiosulfatarculus sandiegensis]KIX14426.1 hypothetical protein X474_09810 [Dethiosulfatarculus sandiegensis]
MTGKNKTIELKKSISVSGEETSRLEMQEPKLKDREIFAHLKPGIDGSQVSTGDMLDLSYKAACKLCNLTPPEADSLGMEDALKVAEAAMGFFVET